MFRPPQRHAPYGRDGFLNRNPVTAYTGRAKLSPSLPRHPGHRQWGRNPTRRSRQKTRSTSYAACSAAERRSMDMPPGIHAVDQRAGGLGRRGERGWRTADAVAEGDRRGNAADAAPTRRARARAAQDARKRPRALRGYCPLAYRPTNCASAKTCPRKARCNCVLVGRCRSPRFRSSAKSLKR